MTPEQRHSLDLVLGWVGYGLDYSPDDPDGQPPNGALATQSGPGSGGAMADVEEPQGVRDHIRIIRSASVAAAELLRARTDDARAQAAERFPRAVQQVEKKAAAIHQQTAAVAESTAGFLGNLRPAWRRAWEPDGFLGAWADRVLALIDRLGLAARNGKNAAYALLKRTAEGAGSGAAQLQRTTAASAASVKGRLRRLTEARHQPRAFFMTLWRPCSRNDGRSCDIRWG